MDWHSERILVVEDDEGLREDLVLALETEGYSVSDCGSGREAVELAQSQSFDLVVSDIRMAGMDGLDTVERLQKQQPLVATLVITGYTAEADSIRAVRLGVGDYLKKPFRLDEFLSAVARQLSLQKARQARWQREHSMRRTTQWALESLAATLVAAGSPVAQGRLAQRTALEMGLSPEQAAEAQFATLIQASAESAPQLDLAQLPADLSRVVSEIRQEDRQSESLGVSARIALAVTQGAGPDEIEVSAAMQRARQGGESPSPRRRGSLAQVGRSLEQAGQSARAMEVFSQVVAEGRGDRECFEALLGLTRLATADADRCRSLARQAVALGQQLNPLLHAVGSLEAGLRLAQVGYRTEAAELFETARRVAHDLRQPALEAKATLALAGAQAQPVESMALERALSLLLEVEERYELIDAAWWVVPCLLRLQAVRPHPLQERMLSTLGRETPGAFHRLLQSGRLETRLRLSAAAALGESSHPQAGETLRLLTSDPDASVRQAAERFLRATLPQALPPTLRIYSLGGFEVYRGEERVPESAFRSWKQRFLLVRLAGSPRPIPGERLVDEFWPDDAEGGRLSLNVGVSNLRKLLRPSQWPQELDYVPREAAGLHLNPQLPIWHDLNEFLALTAEEGPVNASEESWRRAIQLYRGPFLENCYLDWAVAIRDRAEVLVLEALRKLTAALLSQNRPDELLDYATRLVELDPCSQEAHLSLMKSHLLLGRPEAAVRQFEVCKRTLQRELGMEPSIALLEARQRALLSIP